jgi:hypothetical protein
MKKPSRNVKEIKPVRSLDAKDLVQVTGGIASARDANLFS